MSQKQEYNDKKDLLDNAMKILNEETEIIKARLSESQPH